MRHPSNPTTVYGNAQKVDLPNLDFLRATAVLFVLAGHTLAQVLPRHANPHDVLGWLARLGVLFFFVHTACVLTMSLERHRGPRLFAKFYARRAFRIYPLCVVAVLLVAAFGLTQGMHGSALLANLGLYQNLVFAPQAFGTIWSLPLEVQMYVLLPFLFLLMARIPRLSVLLLLFAVSIPVALWQPAHIARASLLPFIPAFLPGVIAWFLFRRITPRFPAWAFPLLLLAFVAAFLAHPNWTYPAWAVCLVLGLALPFFRQLGSAAVNRTTFHIAKYSYGIYLSHSLLLLCIHLTWRTLPFFLALVALTSVLAYHLVEHPMIRLGYHATKQNKIATSVLAT